MFNLIDTPGHIDFKNEVILSLMVCDGIILLVDSVKGIQAQTFFYFNLAKSLNLTILPVINKIDLPNAQPFVVEQQLQKMLNSSEKILFISSKTEHNIHELFKQIVLKIPQAK
uniref:Tr-type G domain-containing protein n=1 Tax=Meloidogyne incognita TaxID=6306 RepID=A0A914MIX0_MELIC